MYQLSRSPEVSRRTTPSTVTRRTGRQQCSLQQTGGRLASSSEPSHSATTSRRSGNALDRGTDIRCPPHPWLSRAPKADTSFHPLHVIPANLKETLPYPLLTRMFPELVKEVEEEGSVTSRFEADLMPVVGKSLSDNKTQAGKTRR